MLGVFVVLVTKKKPLPPSIYLPSVSITYLGLRDSPFLLTLQIWLDVFPYVPPKAW